MTMTMVVPVFDQADRMRKTLREAEISVNEMAAYLEVTRETVSGWLNGRHAPSAATLMLWAQRTSVPLAWLRDGREDGGEGSRLSESNRRPSHYKDDGSSPTPRDQAYWGLAA